MYLFSVSYHIPITLLICPSILLVPPLPGGGNKYSERVCKLLAGEDGIGSVVDTLAPAVVEYLGGMTRLPWGAQVLPEHSEHILRFALLAMEVRD